MTEEGWITLGTVGAGFIVQGVAFIIARTRDLESIKRSIDEKVGGERLERTIALNKARENRDSERDKISRDFAENQLAQDHIVGEMGHSLRSFTAKVEKEMHQIEIWGRDNYVQKPELDSVRNAIQLLGADIKVMFADMKNDVKEDIRELKENQRKE